MRLRRHRRLGALRPSQGAILRVFIAEGLYIGLLGLVLGLGLGIGGCLLLSHYGLPLDPGKRVDIRVVECSAKNVAANAAKPVDSYFYSHAYKSPMKG